MNVGQTEQGTVASRAVPPEDAAVVRVEKLVKCFGSNRVLDGIDLDIAKGEAVSLMGQSGGGKTTLLRCINLLEEPTEGLVEVGGEVVSKDGESLHRARRVQLRQRVGMVFQSFNLFQRYRPGSGVGRRYSGEAGRASEYRACRMAPRTQGLGAAVRRVVPAGVHGALDAGLVGMAALDAVRDKGAFVAVAAGAAPVPLRGTRVHNVWIHTDGPRLAELAALVDAGQLTPRVAATLPLAQVATAHERVAAGGLRGRIVLTLDG
jgi:hypothetical protein